MIYPLLSEYKESILSAEDNFDKYVNLRPVLDDTGEIVMSSGNFAVVFKMRDESTYKEYAIKCFTKEQPGRETAYSMIQDELKKHNCPYFAPLQYLENELYVNSSVTDQTEFPIVVMDWIEGKSLTDYTLSNLDDKYAMQMLVFRFSNMAKWLLSMPIAHGDIKPDNIIIKDDGTITLVDYDGMYVPAMSGQKAREIGSPNFRHPLRTYQQFDEHIDDFALVSILLSLNALTQNKDDLKHLISNDAFILSQKDFAAPVQSTALAKITSLCFNERVGTLLGLFYQVMGTGKVYNQTALFDCERPIKLTDTNVCDIDIQEGKSDKGCVYSNDGKILLSCINKELEEYEIIPNTLLIADEAFKGCKKLKHIVVPNSVIAIGQHAFFNCEKLDSIILSKQLKRLGQCAFDLCNNLINLTLPSSLEIIENNPFLNNQGGKNISISDNEKYFIQDYMLFESLSSESEDSKLISYFGSDSHVDIPPFVSEIADYAFGGSDDIEDVYISDSVTIIGEAAFNACDKLQFVRMSEYVKTIGARAFGFSSIENIHLPEGLEIIGECCFSYCKKMHTINFPSTLTSLEGINLLNREGKVLSRNWFLEECPLQSIYVVDEEVGFYQSLMPAWSSIIRSIDDSELPEICSEETNALKIYYSEDGTSLVKVEKEKSLQGHYVNIVNIKEGTQYITRDAFDNIDTVDCLILPSTLISIDRDSLSNIIVSSIVSFSDAFCIMEGILYSNDMQRIIKCSTEHKKSIIEIPGSVTHIDSDAFYGVNVGIIALNDTSIPISGLQSLGYHYITYRNKSIVSHYPTKDLILEDIVEDEFGAVYSQDKKVLYYFPHNSKQTYYKIDDKCEIIKSWAFTYVPDPHDGEMFIIGNKLKTIELPKSIRIIENDAFTGCTNLVNLIIHTSYKNILSEVMKDYEETCDSSHRASYYLDKIVYSTNATTDDWEDAIVDEFGVTYSKDGTLLLEGNNVESYSIKEGTLAICEAAFYLCDICHVTLPYGLISIGAGSFCDTGIEHILIPSSVKYIGDTAFCGEALKSIEIEGVISHMGRSVFSPDDNGSSFKSVNLGHSQDLGDMTFAGCHSLNAVIIPKEVKNVGRNPFADTGIGRIVNHSHSFLYEDGLLYTNRYPKRLVACILAGPTVHIKDGTEIIGAYAFNELSQITEIYVPESVIEIEDSAFQGCRNLKHIHFANGLKKIGNFAFDGCSSLSQISLPDTVLEIGRGAFSSCTSITEFRLPKYLVKVGDLVFEYTHGVNIISDSPLFDVFDNCLYSKISRCLLCCTSMEPSVSVKDGTKIIADWAFHNCSSLQSIYMPDSIEKIGECAFWGCKSLKYIIMPKELKELGSSGFYYCESLQKIYVHPYDNILRTLYKDKELRNKIEIITETTLLPTDKRLIDHGGWATYEIDEYSEDGKKYQHCPSYYVDNEQIKEGVEIICNDSFNSLYDETDGYYLNSCHLVIPSTVRYIGQNVFDGAPESILNKSPYFLVENDMLLSCDKKILYRYFGKEQEVNIPDYIEEIIGGAFSSMEMSSITIPTSVRSIGDNPVVNNIIYKEDKTIPCKVISLSDRFITNDGILVDSEQERLIAYFGVDDEYIIPDGIKSIGNNAFFGSNIRTIHLPNSIGCIEETAFYWCFKLEHIFIPKGSKYDFSKILPKYLEDRIIELDS